MGWEFRRSTPSDNVMVPASSDPFEGPKWAPPVWHMPPAVVLAVDLVRLAVRILVFCVRHPILTMVTAGSVWLAWATTPLLPELLLALVVLGSGVWAMVDRVSFVRLVGRPVRARWRHLVVYRRHWQPVMVLSGLAFYRNQREYLPTLKRVHVDACTDRVLVKMLSGQAPNIWEDHTANLAHGFAATSCRIRSANKPGYLWLELLREDALADPIPALPIPASPGAVDLSALPIGRCEDHSPYRLRLLGTHVLIAGATGSGKGSFLWSTVRAMLPAIAAGWVRVWGLDPKRMELAYGRDVFAKYSDDADGGMVDLLEAAVAEMHQRAAAFGGATRTFTPDTTHPFLVVMVDELAFLTAYHPDRAMRKRAEAAIATLTSQGRSVGVAVLAALQDPRKEVINLRNLFPDRIALRLDESDQVDMVLGDGARDRGATADQISTDPATGAGVGFVRREDSPDPIRVRAAHVTDGDIHAMTVYLTERPAPLGAGDTNPDHGKDDA